MTGTKTIPLLSALRDPEQFEVEPNVPVSCYVDSFGNRCDRLFVTSGRLEVRNHVIVENGGRILMARGCEAVDAALTTTYGVSRLESFHDWTDEFSR